MTLRSASSARTRALGARIARALVHRGPRRAAAVVALEGELGSGKTTLVQGAFRALGAGRAPSPTFVIMRRARLRAGPFVSAYHIDAYRLHGAKDARSAGILAVLRDPQNIVFVEWADRIARCIPRGAYRVRLFHAARGRRIELPNQRA